MCHPNVVTLARGQLPMRFNQFFCSEFGCWAVLAGFVVVGCFKHSLGNLVLEKRVLVLAFDLRR